MIDEADPRIQYEVIDRPLEQIQVYGDRHYVQPQWIVDSFNAGYLLDVSLYGPGKTLPPHLSPFYSASSIKVEKSEEEKSRIELQKMLMSNKTRKSYEKHEKEVQREHDEQAYLASKRE